MDQLVSLRHVREKPRFRLANLSPGVWIGVSLAALICVLLWSNLQNRGAAAALHRTTAGQSAPSEKKSGHVITEVKVGQVSEKVDVLGKLIRILPNADGVSYELTDTSGRVFEQIEARNWPELRVQYVRFKPSKHDITCIIED